MRRVSEKEWQALQRENEELRIENHALRDAAGAYEEETQKVCEEMRGEIDALKGVCSKLWTEIATLQAALNDSQWRYITAAGELQTERSEVEQLRVALEKSFRDVERWRERNAQLERSLTSSEPAASTAEAVSGLRGPRIWSLEPADVEPPVSPSSAASLLRSLDS